MIPNSTGMWQTPISDPSVSRNANEAKQSVAALEEQVEKLTLICHAMWELLRERTHLQEADLMQRVQELDLADGTADGRRTRKVSQCPQCQRTMSPRHQRCLYCGHEKLITGVFEAL